MTSNDETISGLISETEPSQKDPSLRGKRLLLEKDNKRRLKKKVKPSDNYNTDETITEDFMDEGTMSHDFEQTEDFHTESSVKQKKKKPRRRGNNKESMKDYLDIEASSDNEDETMQDQSEDAEITKAQRDKLFNEYLDNHKSQKKNYFQDLIKEDPELLARRYEESEEIDFDGDYEDPENTKFTMLPSLKDPKLFRVRCRIGSEREAAICLMNKYLIEKGTKNEISIFSASALDKFTGCIFVEAHRDFHVKEAIKGLKILNMNSVNIIPVKEITQIFTPDPSKNVNIEVGQFVRIKRGIYDGDLAIVQDFDDGLKRIKISVVPRLLSGNMDDDFVGDNKENRLSHFEKMREMKRKNMRPSQRFFNPNEFKDTKDLTNTRDGSQRGVKVYGWKGKTFEDGLLMLKVPLANLQTENVVPTFEEVQMFQKAEGRKEYREDLMERAKRTIEESKKFLKNLEKGDKIRIISGDLKGLTGTVIEVSDNGIKVQPMLEALSEPIDFMPNEIVKIFEVGDHVEILSGKFKGLTGNIIKVEENIAHIISEDNKEVMQVLLNDVKYTTNVVVKQPTSIFDHKEYNKHDLVILNDNKTVAVVVSVLRDTVVVYDTEGHTKTISKIQIANKITNRGHTKNAYGQEIYPKCIVRVSDGILKGQLATVKHVYSNFLFLYTEDRQENAGIFVEHINNCYFISANMYDNTRMLARFNNPVLAKANEEQLVSQNYLEDKKPVQAKSRQDPKSKRINLIGQTKTVIKGTWKGYQGIILGLTETMARLELSAKAKVINIPIDCLNIEAAEREGFSSTLMTGKTPIYKGANSPFLINTPAYNPE